MCTAFVHKGKDRICGFNFDVPDGAMKDVKLFMDGDSFWIGFPFTPDLAALPEGMKEIPAGYLPYIGGYLRIEGVHRNGSFGSQLNVLSYPKAPFAAEPDTVPLYALVDRFLSAGTGLDGLLDAARTKRIVNMPSAAAEIPDAAMHSLLSDRSGRVVILEPGNGYAEICDRFAVMSNFPMLILPGDLREDRYGYYGADRYETVVNMLADAGEEFSPADALKVLDAVKQTGYAPTRVSFVYTEKENAVYYVTEHDFAHVRKHCFAEG